MTTADKLREMNSTEALREIAEKHKFGYQEYVDHVVSEYTALISEHYYPKEFVEWITISTEKGNLWKPADVTHWIFWNGIGDHKLFKSTDELFNYWKENEQ